MFRPGQTAGRPVRGHALDFAAGGDTGWHRHPRGQLVHALSGTLTCDTVDGTWLVPPDRAVWLPPGRRHRLAAQGPVAARLLYLRPDVWDGGTRCRVLAVGPLLARRFPLRMGETGEVTPATPWEDLFLPLEPDPEAGPIAVEVAYRILPANAEDFLDALSQMRAPRRRDGATFWRVYRDLSDPARYVERFIVTSWAEYLHQRARATQADQEIEAHLRTFLLDGESVSVQHYIAER